MGEDPEEGILPLGPIENTDEYKKHKKSGGDYSDMDTKQMYKSGEERARKDAADTR
jgi:hypothetical protein